jgi:hypothetical protein
MAELPTTTFVTGQQAITGAAAKLNAGSPTNLSKGFRLKNLSTSTAPMFYGNSGVTTTTGDELAPGESVVLPIADLSTVYVIATTSGTTKVSWVGLVN